MFYFCTWDGQNPIDHVVSISCSISHGNLDLPTTVDQEKNISIITKPEAILLATVIAPFLLNT